mmetsp:Transcript_34129/g.55227  ORF Transcript_34129/g.55227 Transcript_34129/m.55227 type:complete len:165 (+) Transcript_34129:459-953(+)
MFLPILILLFLFCFKESYPTNFILLGGFTVCFGYTVGTICSLFDTWTVLEAVAITGAIVMALTVYTMQSKRDFSFLGAGLFAALFALVIASFIQMFVRSPLLDFLLMVGGIIIFSLYIIYDTWQLMERHSVDEYILAAINHYLDIMNLFLQILKLIASSKNRSE